MTENRTDNLRVSVIVPTYHRAQMLADLLGDLERQSCRRGEFEVIVVDDGSSDETRQVVKAAADDGLEVIYVAQARQGSAAARNNAAARARSPLLVFLDDDMRVDADYVGGLADLHGTERGVVGMGTERPYTPPDATVYQHLATEPTYRDTASAPSDPPPLAGADVEVGFTDCITNNLSVRKADFETLGGFEDVAGDGPTWWGDVDFGYRAAQAGFRFRRSQRACCVHRDYSTRDLATAARRAQDVSLMVHRLFAKHVALRDALPMFEDKSPVQWRNDSPMLVLRKGLRAAASQGPVIGLLESVTRLVERRVPSPRLLRPLYRWVLGGYLWRGYRQGLMDARQRERQGEAFAVPGQK